MVLPGDDMVLSTPPCTRQLLNLFEEVWESVVSIKRVPLDETPQYVIVEGEKDDRDKT